MKRSVISLGLLLAVLASCLTGAAAVSVPNYFTYRQQAAVKLYQCGLLNGRGELPNGLPDLDEDGSVTRGEAVVLAVRLAGAEAGALSGAHGSHSFSDVEDWADGYVATACALGIANGLSAEEFGFSQPVTVEQYLTMVLRALGFRNVDWQSPYAQADRVGLVYRTGTFTRGDLAAITYSALNYEKEPGLTWYEFLDRLGCLTHRTMPVPKLVPGPVLTDVSNTASVDTVEELCAAMAQIVRAHYSTAVLTVPEGQERALASALVKEEIRRFPDVQTLSATITTGTVTVAITYRDHARVMAYLEGRSDSLSEEDTRLLSLARQVTASLVNGGMSEYERVKAIHDYLAETVTYQETGPRSHSALGALEDHLAVCQGYTQAFSLLCYLSGVDCAYISGTATDLGGRTEPHSWNMVKVGSAWYHVDVTWDDPTGGALSYDYFLVADASMSRHTWTQYPSWPRASRDYGG